MLPARSGVLTDPLAAPQEPETGHQRGDAGGVLVVRRAEGPAQVTLFEHEADRDQRIVHLRFFEGATQQEIADDIGVTQMHVSRLIKKILAELRRQLESTAREREGLRA